MTNDPSSDISGFSLKLIAVLGIICIFYTLSADTGLVQTVRGTVIDKESGFPVSDANVVIKGTDPVLGSSTDQNGMFRIAKVPVGRHSVEITHIDYEPVIMSDVLIGTGKEIVINIGLIESVTELSSITVTAEKETEKQKTVNEMVTLSSRTITLEETGMYAASVNDPARTAISFAGVATSGSDAMNEISVRGNSPRGVQWIVEGVSVTNPNHFAEEGNSGGAICLINNITLDRSDFLTGAWPANYGNALSGIFDISLRSGNPSVFEHAVQFGIMGVDFSSEGPLGITEGSSYLFDYRYSTLALFDAAGLTIVDKNKGLPDFQDISYKMFLPTQNKGIFSIWGIGGLSSTVSDPEIETGITYDGQEYKYLEDEGEKAESGIGIAGITHTYFFNKDNFLRSAISLSYSGMKSEETGLINNEFEKVTDIDFTNVKSVLSLLYNKKIRAGNTLQLGAILNDLRYDTKSSEYDEVSGMMTRNADASGRSGLYQGFIQSEFRLNREVTAVAGLHGSYFELNKKFSAEPRGSVRWDITDERSFSAGAGIHSQLNPLSLYMAADSSGSEMNKDLDFLKAVHYAVSYSEKFSGSWRVKTELYYQDLYSIPIAHDTLNSRYDGGYLATYSALNASAGIDYLKMVSKGTGRNYGIELTVEKFFEKGWYFLSTNSLYEAKYKGLDGIERDTKYSGNYIFNLLGGKEFNLNQNTLGLNTRVILAGGLRDIPVLEPRVKLDDYGQPVIDPVTGEEEMFAPKDYSHAYSKQMSGYFRIDLGINYRLNYPGIAHMFSIDIQNVTNRENVRKIDYYDTQDMKYVYKTQSGIIPSFKYKIEF
jgi:hypothetical protein